MSWESGAINRWKYIIWRTIKLTIRISLAQNCEIEDENWEIYTEEHNLAQPRRVVSGSFAQILERVTSEPIFYWPPSGLSESILLSSSLYVLPENFHFQSVRLLCSKYSTGCKSNFAMVRLTIKYREVGGSQGIIRCVYRSSIEDWSFGSEFSQRWKLFSNLKCSRFWVRTRSYSPYGESVSANILWEVNRTGTISNLFFYLNGL